MDIQREKLLLIEKLLLTSDVRILEQVREVLKKENNPVVGYGADGRIITQRDFIRKIEEAESEYNKNNYQSIDEVDKESRDW